MLFFSLKVVVHTYESILENMKIAMIYNLISERSLLLTFKDIYFLNSVIS